MSDEQYARTGRFMFILVWIIIFIGLFLFFHYQGPTQGRVLVANQHEFVLTPDSNGHYFIEGRVNEYPVEFIIDTGASLVAIPQQIADKLHLTGKYPISLSTANGQITGSLTRLEKISFGAFTLFDVKAVIIPSTNEDTVLLGMNILTHFDITQSKKKLILREQKE